MAGEMAQFPTAANKKELWKYIFLDEKQVADLLEHVKKTASHPFIYPMFVFAAYTGARRSEICRSMMDDFRFDDDLVMIRERKRRKDLAASSFPRFSVENPPTTLTPFRRRQVEAVEYPRRAGLDGAWTDFQGKESARNHMAVRYTVFAPSQLSVTQRLRTSIARKSSKILGGRATAAPNSPRVTPR